MNANALKGEIKRNGLTLAQAGHLIGLSASTMQRKLKNGSFGIKEAEKLIKLLDIREPCYVFFDMPRIRRVTPHVHRPAAKERKEERT